MAVQLVVQQGETRDSVTVNLPPTEELGEGEGVTANAETATAAALISSISTAAQSDSRLTAEESQSLQLNPQVTAENEEMSAAAQFGELFKKRGDEVNALIQRSREEGRDFADNVAEEEDPNEAIQSFLEVAAHAFEIGPDGLGTFNCGRLITMFYLGYDICVSYLKRHGVTLIIQFVERLVSQLIRFLSRTGFFSWLFETGGWRCVVAIAKTDRYFQGLFHGLIIATAAAVAFYTFSGLKKLLWKS